MLPSCFQLDRNSEGHSLYLGEVSTEECLLSFVDDTPLTVTEFGATRDSSGWVGLESLPPIVTVADLVGFLRSADTLVLIDFAAEVGAVRVSTHDDGEATLTFSSEDQAFAFLRGSLARELAETVIPILVANRGRYVSLKSGTPHTFATFDEYLQGL